MKCNLKEHGSQAREGNRKDHAKSSSSLKRQLWEDWLFRSEVNEAAPHIVTPSIEILIHKGGGENVPPAAVS